MGELQDVEQLKSILALRYPEWDASTQTRVIHFYELLAKENERQNLTRLISPQNFLEGHLEDVVALLKSELLGRSAMDLGSGGGVPGLLAACIDQRTWFLVDSEARKADFLARASAELSLKHVRVIAGRGEEVLLRNSVDSVVARAVGPVERIFGWIGKCSTWNNLVLLKGPGWEDEWKAFSSGRYRTKLQIERDFAYEVGAEKKRRRIVRLGRVPRGTSTGG